VEDQGDNAIKRKGFRTGNSRFFISIALGEPLGADGGLPAGPKKRAISASARRQGDIMQPIMSGKGLHLIPKPAEWPCTSLFPACF
jgi:hypothetical protein